MPGPWVAVPAQGEASFLLECPKRQGTIGGVDALASSADVHLSWDARAAVPLKSGTTTGSIMFFRAGSAHARPGSFQPTLGCIPPPKTNPRSTLSARVTHPLTPSITGRRPSSYALARGRLAPEPAGRRSAS